jgi:hypothetical protein
LTCRLGARPTRRARYRQRRYSAYTARAARGGCGAGGGGGGTSCAGVPIALTPCVVRAAAAVDSPKTGRLEAADPHAGAQRAPGQLSLMVHARLRCLTHHLQPAAGAPIPADGVEIPDGDSALVAAATATALALPNRGPLRMAGAGSALNPSIAPLFEEYGFFVLEGVLSGRELDFLRRDIGGRDWHGEGLIDRAPAGPGFALDRAGRPAEQGRGKARWNFRAPLSDPNGGRGRSPAEVRGAVASSCPVMSSSPQFVCPCWSSPSLLAPKTALRGENTAHGCTGNAHLQAGIRVRSPL